MENAEATHSVNRDGVLLFAGNRYEGLIWTLSLTYEEHCIAGTRKSILVLAELTILNWSKDLLPDGMHMISFGIKDLGHVFDGRGCAIPQSVPGTYVIRCSEFPEDSA